MSWVTQESSDFIVKTGDGVQFYPYWFRKSVSKKQSFNTSKFEFKNISGSLVLRGNPKGTEYDIEIIFTGADHLTQSDLFRDSATDPAPWIIQHPTYGKFVCQPSSIEYDNTRGNRTIITASVCETIEKVNLIIDSDYTSEINHSTDSTMNAFIIPTIEIFPEPNVSVLNNIKNYINSTYNNILKAFNGAQKNLTAFMNAYNKVNNIINTTLWDAGNLIQNVIAFYLLPATFVNSVQSRLNTYQNTLNAIGADISLLNNPYQKQNYETNAGACIGGMCLTTTLNVTNDYLYRQQIVDTINTIQTNYQNYLTNLYTLQTTNGGELNSYMPNADSLMQLDNLVNLTMTYLLSLSTNAQIQLIYVVPTDTNIIPLTYLLYGLLQDDSTIQTLIQNNNISTDELFIIKKGRKIAYYS